MELHHLAIFARDVARVGAFYRDVMGLAELDAPRPGVVWLRLGDDAILMIEPGELASIPMLALRITRDQRERWRERFRAAGVEVTDETRFSLYVRDPEGGRIAVSHWPDSADPPV